MNQLRITGNKENGQVFVECNADGLTDDWVEKIANLNVKDTIIRKCHAYTGKDVLVRFSCIHSNVNVEKDIIEGFLRHFGKVKEHFPVKNKGLGHMTESCNSAAHITGTSLTWKTAFYDETV